MNRLSRKERAAIIRALVEGNSLRSVTRLTGHSINTVSKLLVDIGAACAAYMDENVRYLDCKRIQADEIWAYCYAKARNVPEDKRDTFGYGDVWTWTALDPDTKLIVAWLVSDRSMGAARDFMADLASRVSMRVQITTDANTSYKEAIDAAFGSEVDYAQLLKDYGIEQSEDASPTARRYSPNVVKSIEKRVVSGNPDPDHITTSHVERNNLSMRMGMRRFTRLTNGFSKKVENHAAAVALHFMFQNFARPMKVLANPYPRTPAMAAGIADRIWTCEDIAALLD
ncbi:MAG TPA: IS1 family transposase [Candidatus Limnocylindria bacterium]|nr:IS1 family transposase [Candidatus Limnocylindria bacterium]